MSLYLLRHGQTNWNKAGIVQGRYDVPLNDEGRRQAKEAKKTLDEVTFDYCYCSPLCRARETMELALGDRIQDIEVVFDDRLVEMAYGDYEGTDWRAGDYQSARRRLAYRYAKGESYFDVAHRAFSLLDELKEKATKGNVLLVCHGGIARVINSYFIDAVDNDSFVDNICPNGGIRKYEYTDRYIAPVIEIPDNLKGI